MGEEERGWPTAIALVDVGASARDMLWIVKVYVMDWVQLRGLTAGSPNITAPVASVIVTFFVLSTVPQSQFAWVNVRVLFPRTIRDVMFRANVWYTPPF